MTIFDQALKESSLPTTTEALTEVWNQQLIDAGASIANTSNQSPFWRLISAIVTAPVLLLLSFISSFVLPNSFLRYATGKWLELLAFAVNVTRNPATYTVGNVKFSRLDGTGELVIPAGTIIETPDINGTIYSVVATKEITFLDSELSVFIPVIAAQKGNNYNLAGGYYSILKTPIPGVTVTNKDDWISIPGAEEESDDELRYRCRDAFGTAAKFHTDSAYRSIISEFNGVRSDYIFFVHDAPRGAGTADAYVLFELNAPAETYITAINNHITDNGFHGHGDDLQVFSVPEVSTDITATTWFSADLSDDYKNALLVNIENYIRSAFRENKDYKPTLVFPYKKFSFSVLSKELHSKFLELEHIEFNLLSIDSDLEIPVINSLLVSENV